MGNANPLAVMGAKKSAADAANSAKEGLNVLTASQTDEQKEKAAKSKDRAAAFEAKKREREERKKKLNAQRAAHKAG
eukprot:CAMPEP_0201229808 /NCGR_PEP_ID=MMETSP0852-20130820/1238_1 /ASSEMBLY_ACC=CAM_ASM_000632 /TAXON_ID=183588 /ORGANISM="Pseudo-nitzschia fraudulenta, Strain WWA7" /LENGTH=76 /DNA_ID=CAMNT_0047520265 /DNA_START=241 /DNA_END=471 /DNA_ORIENTATION=+